MRIHHIFGSVLIFSLFMVVLFSETQVFMNAVNPDMPLDDDGSNISALVTELNILSSTRTEVGSIAEKSPGGENSLLSGEDDTSEGALQKSGVGVVASVGRFLYSVPKAMITSMAGFFGIRQEFVIVSTTMIILIVAIIVVSSILRNRL